MTQANFQTEGIYTPDSLIASNAHLLVGRKVTIATGQVLPRGAVLGKVTSANTATTPAGDAGNTGTATFGTITVDTTALDGTYTVEVTAAKDGATGAAFKVTGPTGKTATGNMGTAFSGLSLGFTITDGAAAAAAVVGDTYTFAVVAAQGEYKLSASAANDGSQTPDLILAEAVNTTSGDVAALAYERGDFNGNALTLGTGHTVASIRDGLRAKGITLLATIA